MLEDAGHAVPRASLKGFGTKKAGDDRASVTRVVCASCELCGLTDKPSCLKTVQSGVRSRYVLRKATHVEMNANDGE
jgi:hypothetical protein